MDIRSYKKCESCKKDLTEKNFGTGQISSGKSRGWCKDCVKDGKCDLIDIGDED